MNYIKQPIVDWSTIKKGDIVQWVPALDVPDLNYSFLRPYVLVEEVLEDNSIKGLYGSDLIDGKPSGDTEFGQSPNYPDGDYYLVLPRFLLCAECDQDIDGDDYLCKDCRVRTTI